MKLSYTNEIVKDGTHRKIQYVVRKVASPFVSTCKEWYCVYVESRRDFSEEELEKFPVEISCTGPYLDRWGETSLTDKQCIGWDYFMKETSQEEVLKETKKVINYLTRTFEEYSDASNTK